ncbi:MAG: hypothetical protein KF819_40115, partial [Labilithrix sp.]|nr:hypothetical protein [Labilithrix sp.]
RRFRCLVSLDGCCRVCPSERSALEAGTTLVTDFKHLVSVEEAPKPSKMELSMWSVLLVESEAKVVRCTEYHLASSKKRRHYESFWPGYRLVARTDAERHELLARAGLADPPEPRPLDNAIGDVEDYLFEAGATEERDAIFDLACDDVFGTD